MLKLPIYTPPDFSEARFVEAPNVSLGVVERDGISPRGYHAMSIFPEYFKVNGSWFLVEESRMDTVAVVRDEPGHEKVDVVEFRNLKAGDKVVLGRTEDGSEGIFLYTDGFREPEGREADRFAFRSGRSRETAFSIDYDRLYDVLRHEKANGGFITWVLGTSLALDREARQALERLIRAGFVNGLISGQGLVAFDLERERCGTTWGQKVFRREQNTRDNMFQVVNDVRAAGSIEAFLASSGITGGITKALVDCHVPYVLAGTIRDKLLLPGTYDNVYRAQDAMRALSRKSSTVVMASTILFTVATGNMTPSYNRFGGKIRPVYIYTVDIQEFAVNKLSDRGTLTATSLVTNSQDFVRHVARALTR